MTRSDAPLNARSIGLAIALAVAGIALAWLCFRTAMVRALPAGSPTVAQLAPTHADAVLTDATIAFVQRRGRLDPATLARVRHAAAVDPLDARAFLILGNQQLQAGQLERATKTLEAGQRLDPRNRLIHLLLLERYLRSGRFADASAQFAVLARLVGATQPIIATAMAKMTMAPDMRAAVRHTLSTDPQLERQVLTALASSDVEPSDVFALASPAALADAGDKESWGPVLVSRLVANGRYGAARTVWQRIYHLPASALATPIFNPDFRRLAASPPFDWTLTAGSIGAADPQDGSLAIDYYDRDSGDLASQLLVLSPGRYRFAFVAEGGKPDATPNLFWTIACARGAKTVLVNVAVPEATGARRADATFAVPADCPAQTLTLRGEAGEFPTPVNLTIRGIAIQHLSGNPS